MLVDTLLWIICVFLLNSMICQWFSIEINEQTTNLYNNPWISLQFNELLIFLLLKKWKFYASKYNPMKYHCFSIKNNKTYMILNRIQWNTNDALLNQWQTYISWFNSVNYIYIYIYIYIYMCAFPHNSMIWQ